MDFFDLCGQISSKSIDHQVDVIDSKTSKSEKLRWLTKSVTALLKHTFSRMLRDSLNERLALFQNEARKVKNEPEKTRDRFVYNGSGVLVLPGRFNTEINSSELVAFYNKVPSTYVITVKFE